jgi:hypothetical protein
MKGLELEEWFWRGYTLLRSWGRAKAIERKWRWHREWWYIDHMAYGRGGRCWNRVGIGFEMTSNEFRAVVEQTFC